MEADNNVLKHSAAAAAKGLVASREESRAEPRYLPWIDCMGIWLFFLLLR